MLLRFNSRAVHPHNNTLGKNARSGKRTFLTISPPVSCSKAGGGTFFKQLFPDGGGGKHFFYSEKQGIFYTRPFCEFFVASHTRLFVVVVDVAVCYTARARISVKGLGGRGLFFFYEGLRDGGVDSKEFQLKSSIFF